MLEGGFQVVWTVSIAFSIYQHSRERLEYGFGYGELEFANQCLLLLVKATI